MPYMPATKFEMSHFNGPDDMHRVAMRTLGIGLSWHSEGDAVKDPDHYTESFDVLDRYYPENNREGLSRQECETHIWNLYCDEVYK